MEKTRLWEMREEKQSRAVVERGNVWGKCGGLGAGEQLTGDPTGGKFFKV